MKDEDHLENEDDLKKWRQSQKRNTTLKNKDDFKNDEGW